jgi:hypothetical protein
MGRDGFFVQAGLRVQRPPVHDRGRDRLPTPVYEPSITRLLGNHS